MGAAFGTNVRNVPSPINLAFLGLQRRAEQGDPVVLVQTFVDVGPLFTLLSSADHQVLYGRRGTGKTHALHYLKAQVEDRGDTAAFIDLRTVGSSGGIYGDPGLPLAERGTRLVSDVLAQLIEHLMTYVVEQAEHGGVDVTAAMRLLDRLDEAAVDVRVTGEREQETVGESEQTETSAARAGANLSIREAKLGASLGATEVATHRSRSRDLMRGVERHHVHFGQVSSILRRLVESLPARRLWVILDEWVAIPLELQPLLADLIKRALLPVQGVTVKIAAIEQRSAFRVERPGDYLGFELGADIQADVDLDDYMVFENDAEKAKEFFRELLYRHVRVLMMDEGIGSPPANATELQRTAFTQRTAMDDFVRAAEGVPRDAINILRIAAQRADRDPIAVEHVRAAARRWYLGDKEKDIPEDAKVLLHWIVDKVIGERRARAFLLEQRDRNDPLIATLYDARVLHVMKRGVAAQDRAGVRFDVYAIDYGCYVELINTAKAPEGLYQSGDEGEWVEVPANDYRSIRRAILELPEFEGRQLTIAE